MINYQKEKLRKLSHILLERNKIRYLGINLTKEVKELYLENYKILKKIQISGNAYRAHG